MTNFVVKWYFIGVERAVKGSPDLIRIQNQRFSIGRGANENSYHQGTIVLGVIFISGEIG